MTPKLVVVAALLFGAASAFSATTESNFDFGWKFRLG